MVNIDKKVYKSISGNKKGNKNSTLCCPFPQNYTRMQFSQILLLTPHIFRSFP